MALRFSRQGDMVVRFAGFELDHQRSELRHADGTAIRLRPKALDMLSLFVASQGQVLSKRHLIEAVWPDVHVSEDSLFQCISELRTALGDERRQMIRLVSGQGYVFDAPVAEAEAEPGVAAEAAIPGGAIRGPRLRPRLVFGLLILAIAASLAMAVLLLAPQPGVRPPTSVAVMPFTTGGEHAGTAASVATRLSDGLARIDNIRVALAASQAGGAGTDYVVTGDLARTADSWTAEARLVDTRTHEVQSVAAITVEIGDTALPLQQSRIAAGIGHVLALRLNALLNSTAEAGRPDTRVVIEQATAFLTQTSPERFGEAERMLQVAIAAEPGNVDLAVALAALQLRGIQMVWYDGEASKAAAANAKATLEGALRFQPDSIAVLEAYCRFLNATNAFAESLVACARALSFDPWNGIALYHIGVAQMQLGRFEDALASFERADQFDTPTVARWTWLLGAGWVNLMMDRDAAAADGLQRSIAITPASGRPLMLLAAAYQRLGRQAEAEAALAKALGLRPGTTALNVAVPTKGASPVFLAASARAIDAMVLAGLPPR
jgi:DNA-binding winged helix-turn-helix (wHTH) protein/tetratricopeptide (TPR) repeat protein